MRNGLFWRLSREEREKVAAKKSKVEHLANERNHSIIQNLRLLYLINREQSLSKIKFKMRRLSNPVPDGMASSSVRAGLIFAVSGWETGTFSSFPAWGTFFFSPLFLMRGEKKKKRNLSCTFPLSPSFFCGFGDMMPR